MSLRKSVYHILTQLSNLYKIIIFVFYPPYCVRCKVFLFKNTVFCDDCMALIHSVATVPLKVTKNLSIPVLALSAYQDPLKQLILAKGRSNRTASYQLAGLMWNNLPLQSMKADFIIPIPLYWRRFAGRGYNQSEEIGRFLCRKKRIKLATILRRIRHTKFQSSFGGQERSDNVKGCFRLCVENSSEFEGAHIIVIDDLMTTGSTLKEAVRALVKLKPASITAIVACRVV